MPRQKNGVNKSEEIRQLLKANPEIGAQEAIAALGAKGIKISDNLYYFVKGHIKGRKGKKKKAQHVVANIGETNGVAKVAEANNVPKSDALSTILKVKALAIDVGGLKKLKALVEALSA
jgi:hypothetical protein